MNNRYYIFGLDRPINGYAKVLCRELGVHPQILKFMVKELIPICKEVFE